MVLVFSPNRFLKTSTKAPLILDLLTSTTLARPPTTPATSAAPLPGRTGSCGGGRGTLLTEQVRGTRAPSELVEGMVIPQRASGSGQPRTTGELRRLLALSFGRCALGGSPLALPVPASQLSPHPHPVCLLSCLGHKERSHSSKVQCLCPYPRHALPFLLNQTLTCLKLQFQIEHEPDAGREHLFN